jgi:DNA replication and repair protein RecF
LVRVGTKSAAVVLTTTTAGATNRITVTITPGSQRVTRVNGSRVEQVQALEARPLVCLFIPDRLALVKGAPAGRRAHLDAVVGALWPSRRGDRGSYARALAQRNALVASIRAGRAGRATLAAWNRELAANAVRLRDGRAEAVGVLAAPLASRARELGLEGVVGIDYRTQSEADDVDDFAAELEHHTPRDLERGFSTYGPHRDDLVLRHQGRSLRKYGSQGQQRIVLLALLFAERDILAAARGTAPLMLLDDVFSELDRDRRERLLAELSSSGQSVITTTDLADLPASAAAKMVSIEIPSGVTPTAQATTEWAA